MARERDKADLELQRLEAQLGQTHEPEPFENYIDSPVVSPSHRMAADYLGLNTPGFPTQSDQISLHAVEALRQMCENSRAGQGPSSSDWRSTRPKSARYMRPRCRVTPDGGGGAPLQRPASAPSTRRPPKTERWRESGLSRWPKESDKVKYANDPSDGDPLRRTLPKQPRWEGELWTRSLRRPGVQIQDPAFHDVAQRGMRELHEEWQAAPMPNRPQSARIDKTRPKLPYGGSTTTGKVAIPRRHNQEAWIEKPVSTGKMALSHFQGQRYAFRQEPRHLDWDEYQNVMKLPQA